MEKKIVILFLIFMFMISFTGYVSAITGSIGNARMVLRAETGDTIEKSILVKNVNNMSVNIELFASGDLEENINIKDKQFVLAPGEEKKAFFTIKVKEEGTKESKINIKFSPLEEGNGVGLSSTIIVIAEKGSWFDWGEDSDEQDDSDNEDNSDVQNNHDDDNQDNSVTPADKNSFLINNRKNLIAIFLSVTSIILFIFVISLFVLLKKTKIGIELVNENEVKNKKRQIKPKKSVKHK